MINWHLDTQNPAKPPSSVLEEPGNPTSKQNSDSGKDGMKIPMSGREEPENVSGDEEFVGADDDDELEALEELAKMEAEGKSRQ